MFSEIENAQLRANRLHLPSRMFSKVFCRITLLNPLNGFGFFPFGEVSDFFAMINGETARIRHGYLEK